MGSRTGARLPRTAAAFLVMVVVAAGASGAALLVAPGSTHRYFSWTLQPPAAAALIGGFYLGSAVAFGAALTLPWRQVRPLMVAALGLAVPTLVLTVVHDEVFDFSRWQAIAWVALFATAPAAILGILATNPSGPRQGLLVRRSMRLVLAGLTLMLAVSAGLIWLDATRDEIARYSPVDLVRLTGTYLGAWCSFLTLLCGWAAWRGRWDDARIALITLAAAGGGASIGLIRSFADIRHPVVALAVAVTITALAVVAYLTEGTTS
jgi:hypothetical protein